MPDFTRLYTTNDYIQVEQYLMKKHEMVRQPQILKAFKKKGARRMKNTLGKMFEYLVAGQKGDRKFMPRKFMPASFDIDRQLNKF